MHILSLPVEVLLAICQELELVDLCSLAETCKALYSMVNNLAFKDYLHRHTRACITRRCFSDHPRDLVRYNYQVDQSWTARSFVSRAITEPWPRLNPVLALSPSRLAIGAGESVVLFDVPYPGKGHHAQLHRPTYHRIHGRDSRRDISGILFLPDGGDDRLLCIAQADGLVQRMQLSEDRRTLQPTGRFEHPASGVLSMTSKGGTIVTAARNRLISIFAARSPWQRPATFTMHSKPWSVYLDPHQTFVAVGTVGAHPLNVYALTPSGHVSAPSPLAGFDRPSAVYDICHAAEGSVFGSGSSSILISGWYDGATRLHDLRQQNTKQPCMTLADPWDESPVYSVAAGGGSSCYVASGSSRHGVIRLWDVRMPKQGWSMFSPGKDTSPVYSVVMESSRLFGVTDARAFVFDFDPNVSPSDYPATPLSEAAARRSGDASLSWHWTPHYLHGMTQIDTSRRPARMRNDS